MKESDMSRFKFHNCEDFEELTVGQLRVKAQEMIKEDEVNIELLAEFKLKIIETIWGCRLSKNQISVSSPRLEFEFGLLIFNFRFHNRYLFTSFVVEIELARRPIILQSSN